MRARRDHLVREAESILATIKEHFARFSKNPWTEPKALAQAVKMGILDAPHLMGNPAARGETVTKLVNGGWDAIDPDTGKVLTEVERLKRLGIE